MTGKTQAHRTNEPQTHEGGLHGPDPCLPPEMVSHSLNALSAPLLSYEELAIATDSFSPGNFIGKGSFGSVYRGYSRTGELWAVKREDITGEFMTNFRQKVKSSFYVHFMLSDS